MARVKTAVKHTTPPLFSVKARCSVAGLPKTAGRKRKHREISVADTDDDGDDDDEDELAPKGPTSDATVGSNKSTTVLKPKPTTPQDNGDEPPQKKRHPLIGLHNWGLACYQLAVLTCLQMLIGTDELDQHLTKIKTKRVPELALIANIQDFDCVAETDVDLQHLYDLDSRSDDQLVTYLGNKAENFAAKDHLNAFGDDGLFGFMLPWYLVALLRRMNEEGETQEQTPLQKRHSISPIVFHRAFEQFDSRLPPTSQQCSAQFFEALMQQIHTVLRKHGETSYLLDRFAIIQGYTRTCPTCHLTESMTPDLSWVLPVQLPQTGNALLKDLILAELGKQETRDTQCSACPGTAGKCQATSDKKRVLPEILTVRVGRVVADPPSFQPRKLLGRADLFSDTVDLTPYSVAGPGDGAKTNKWIYRVAAVVKHRGRTSIQGHYMAWKRVDDTDTWYHCNDEAVTQVSRDNARDNANSQSWLVFLQRVHSDT